MCLLDQDPIRQNYTLHVSHCSEFQAQFADSCHSEYTSLFSGTSCDHCYSVPEGSRIICIDCGGRATVDLCPELECVNATVTFLEPNRKPHLPSHRMFKVYRIIFDTEIAKTAVSVTIGLAYANATLSGLVEEGREMPRCGHCGTTVSLPCWRCSDCLGKWGRAPSCHRGITQTRAVVDFMCDDCEYKGLAFGKTHTKTHLVIRASGKPEEEERSTEERLQFLEGEITKIKQTLAETKQTLVEMGQTLGKLAEGRS